MPMLDGNGLAVISVLLSPVNGVRAASYYFNSSNYSSIRCEKYILTLVITLLNVKLDLNDPN